MAAAPPSDIWTKIGPMSKHMHDEYYNQVILKVLYQLSADKTIWEYENNLLKDTKIWTSTWTDNVLTEFEQRSNRLEIGVQASFRVEATILLRLVQILIDGNWGSLEDTFREVSSDSNDISIKDTIEALSIGTHVDKHICPDDIKRTVDEWDDDNNLTIRTIVETTDMNMDMWSLGRLLKTYTQRLTNAHKKS